VASAASGGGFWISGTGNERFFVLPSDRMEAPISQGQNVSITGVVLELPSGMRARIGDRTHDEDIYLYASQIEQMKAQQKSRVLGPAPTHRPFRVRWPGIILPALSSIPAGDIASILAAGTDVRITRWAARLSPPVDK
jgi:hypothetical protein